MPYETTNPAGAKALLDGDEGWTYVDVRTEEEFQAGHPPGAYNVPVAFRGPMGMELNEAFVGAIERRFPKEAPLILGCAAGMRSAHACELLSRAGYVRLVNMDGGFSGARTPGGGVREPGWHACGLPVETQAADGRTWRDLSSS